MQPLKIEANDRPVRARKSAPSKTKKRRVVKQSVKRTRTSAQVAKKFLFVPLDMIKGLAGMFSRAALVLNQKKAAPRRRHQKGWRRITIAGCLALGVSALIGGLGYYIVQQEVIAKTANWLDEAKSETIASLGLTIQEVTVAGRDRTKPQSLMKVLNIKRGENIFGFDPETARHRIEALGWVETASVMRRFPDEVFIRLTERRPFARWQRNGKTTVIDRNGAIVTTSDAMEFRYLPKVVGPGANKDAAELFDMLAKTPTLFTRLHNAVRIRDRRWNLEFDTGVTVLLPEEGSSDAWQRLSLMQQEKKVLNKGVMAIDLRSKDKMYVRLKPNDARYRRELDKET